MENNENDNITQNKGAGQSQPTPAVNADEATAANPATGADTTDDVHRDDTTPDGDAATASAPDSPAEADAQGDGGEQASPASSAPAANNKKRKIAKRRPLSFGMTMLASMLGVIIATMVLSVMVFVSCVGFLATLVVSADSKPTLSADRYALQIDLSRSFVERPQDELEAWMEPSTAMPLYDVLCAIDHAAADSHVCALYLYAGEGGAVTWAQSVELRYSLEAFKQTGKPIVAFGNSFSQPAYYLATVADSIVLNPAGMIDYRGMAAEAIFFKEMLDKLNINIDLIRPGSNAYKSAGESYTMTHYSDANREQVRAYLASIWSYVVAGISSGRSIDITTLNHLADNLEGSLAAEAQSAGLVDRLGFASSMADVLKEAYGAEKVYDIMRYHKSLSSSTAADCIAVVYAEGDVMTGTGRGMTRGIYANDLVRALNEAAADSSVKAIVLRVNSPGGAALASESITDAVWRAKAKKPLIVSMGGMAASAGYEMSSGATAIVALPVTLTGSIGVFGVSPEVGTMMRAKLGITTDTVATNANAAGMSIMRPMSPTARALLQRNVESFYVNFCLRVAQGRGVEVEYVDSIARGRVWTGADALGIGLVDTLGGINTAISMAAARAGIDDYSVSVLPGKKDFVTQLRELYGSDGEEQLSQHMRALFPFVDEMIYWSQMEPVQARLPFTLNIE